MHESRHSTFSLRRIVHSSDTSAWPHVATLVPPTLVPLVVTACYMYYERDNLAGVQRAVASLSDTLTFVRAQSSAKHRDNAAQHAIVPTPTLIFSIAF